MGTLAAAFAFLCVIGGPISFLIVIGFAVAGVRDVLRERRRLRAPLVACSAAESHVGRRVMVRGRIFTDQPLRDPITEEAVVHYDIALGGPRAVSRQIALGSLTSVYGIRTSTDVEHDTRSVGFRISDDTGVISVDADRIAWVGADALPEPDAEHQPARAAYLAARGTPKLQWLIHRRVPLDVEMFVIGRVEMAPAPTGGAGYRGEPRVEPRLTSPADLPVIATSFSDPARAHDLREPLMFFVVGAVITLVVTGLGVGVFLLDILGR
jgi:hypothetical protein